jgi:hypothetical protein
MTAPGATDLFGLDYIFNGEPFVSIETKSTLDTDTLDFIFNGEPFVGVSVNAVGNVYVNVLGNWKQANTIYVNQSGVWKTSAGVSANVSGTWKN